MKKKINIYFIGLSAFAVVVTALVSMMLFYRIFQKQVFDDIEAYAHVIQPLDKDFWEQEKNLCRLHKDGLRITLIQEDGSVEYDTSADKEVMDNHRGRPEIRDALEFGEGTSVRWSSTSSVHTLYYAQRLENGMVLRVGKDSEHISQIRDHMYCLVVGVSGIIVLLCVALSHFLTKHLLLPIERLGSNLDEVGKQTVYEEMVPFIQTIQKQHANILNHAKMRQEFTANVSHELKTPLTAISGYAELIGNGMADGEDTRRFANEIHVSSNRLLTLINDIIKLSELDDLEQEFDFEQVDLYKAAQGCLDMLDIQAAKQEITLALKGGTCIVAASKSLMDELLYNLCSNAIRYNNHGGTVLVTTAYENGHAVLSVKDTGIGIPKEHQVRVFERFYRVDKSRSKRSGGTGLGLAIVKHIVAQHKAQIVLESEPGQGTEIRVYF